MQTSSASAATRQSKSSAGRSNEGSGRRKNVSFPTVRAQFSALPVEERLQFLTWLFEGALSHCVATRAYTDVVSASRCASSQDVDMTYDCDQPSSSTELVEAQQPPSRKGLAWSVEEYCLLVNLREEQNLAWSEVTRLFARNFPGRSKGSTGILEHDAQETMAFFGGCRVENAIFINYSISSPSSLALNNDLHAAS
jgi:hypothetical protein